MKTAIRRGAAKRSLVCYGTVAVFFFCLIFSAAKAATNYESVQFMDAAPVLLIQGGRSNSASFELYSGTGQNETGESSSANFGYRSGFYYFPLVTSPVASAVAGDSSVTVSWSAAVGSLGITVSGYSVGKSTALAGPFTYSPVGNVLSSVQSGLSNNTAYYFLVRALDAFGNTVATSSVVSATPTGGAGGGGGQNNQIGGGGGGQNVVVAPSLTVTGFASPKGQVVLLINGVRSNTIVSEANGSFSITAAIPAGDNVVVLYQIDSRGLQSAGVSRSVRINAGESFLINNLVLPPTVTTDKSAVKSGDNLDIAGSGVPNSAAHILIEGKQNFAIDTVIDENGGFQSTVSTKGLPEGDYAITITNQKNQTVSVPSRSLKFSIGKKNETRPTDSLTCPSTDLNTDCRVDLVDFSILLYWFGAANPPISVDFNNDKKVDIIDFSILIYYWTG